MPKAIRCLCVVFPEEIMRGMAVVAGRRGVVAGFLPAIELLAHDMAIGTRARIVAHVRVSLAVPERIKSDAHGQAKPDPENYEFEYVKIHIKLTFTTFTSM